MTAAQLHDMRHAVGWPKLYRNNYCAEVGGEAAARWQDLVSAGLARLGYLINDGADRYYHVTDAGMEAMHAAAHGAS